MVQLLRHRTTVVADTKCKKNVFLIQICIASQKTVFLAATFRELVQSLEQVAACS